MDGQLIPWARATVHLLSHSLQRGSLIFDYMSVHETPRGVAVFRLQEHVERFLNSAEIVGLELEQDASQLVGAVCQTVAANPGATAAKVCAYIPSIEVDVVPSDPHVAVAVAAYNPVSDIIAKNQGEYHFRPALRLWIEKELRNRRGDIIPPQAKVAASYVSPMIAKWQARKRGYDEVLLLDQEGAIAEGPTTNIMLVTNEGEVHTPAEQRVLPGITRRSIIELARDSGYLVKECAIQPAELLAAKEVFLTGTTAGVWPVIEVDGSVIADGKPGPVTRQLKERFQKVTSGADPNFSSWLSLVEGH